MDSEFRHERISTETREQISEEDKRDSWKIATGMAAVDGGTPSTYLLELIEREVRGEISKEKVTELLKENYMSEV